MSESVCKVGRPGPSLLLPFPLVLACARILGFGKNEHTTPLFPAVLLTLDHLSIENMQCPRKFRVQCFLDFSIAIVFHVDLKNNTKAIRNNHNSWYLVKLIFLKYQIILLSLK